MRSSHPIEDVYTLGGWELLDGDVLLTRSTRGGNYLDTVYKYVNLIWIKPREPVIALRMEGLAVSTPLMSFGHELCLIGGPRERRRWTEPQP